MDFIENNFKNKKVKLKFRGFNGAKYVTVYIKVYASRIIASWIKEGGQLRTLEDKEIFRNWLISIGMPEEDIEYVIDMAYIGKSEIHGMVRTYLEEQGLKK